MYLRKIEPLDVDGHRVRAFVYSGNVSWSGPAIIRNARWIIEIDGVQTDGGLDGRSDDTEELVRQHMIQHARSELMRR